ncbi:hypothetical protein CCR75_001846 [Bremia lactucae]|uniref:Cytochrome b5 heme-binding domain-containing protein n=1 Tax=Bremia lactucae TaxID=4779 RepID=A0A976FGD5_BRELC|nr:hypothetical protein CCR75_001846 [Bremia lactucae]
MNVCSLKCMEDQLTLPGLPTMPPNIRLADATSCVTSLEANSKTVDVEELGVAEASQTTQMRQEKSIVVDYEDSDGDQLEIRESIARCASSACGPVLTDESSDGSLLALQRSPSCSLGVTTVAALSGRSVTFEQDEAFVNLAFDTSSDTLAEEKMRCSKEHKLCACEVKLHRSLDSCWLVSGGQVYDVTGLVTVHPGGILSILRKAGGLDCTRDMKFHTKNARKMMEKCFIGKLQQCGDEVDISGRVNCNIM